ncbi:hypothetical protein BDA99DRAFT_537737 [Phascolomyces articulosus]|uniref:Endonuclease/exonuclease/phosphatase domain-containing protein n=1 Tax=Phascolomyces articulosus TaxID=60185 RepID=A0AAD5K026_9FUNG|nr:hypothetical protein BDA99DRAFT_537737 [Phascolomyces articulosus]
MFGHLAIAYCYVCPSTSINSITSTLQLLLNEHPNTAFVIAGDFNVDMNTTNNRSTSLYNFFNDNNMIFAIPNGTHTTHSNTCLDTIYTSLPIVYQLHFIPHYICVFSFSKKNCLTYKVYELYYSEL